MSASRDQRSGSKRKILAAIRAAGRIARIDVAKATGISQATVTTITAEMLSAGLIHEVASDDGDRGARRGRPRVDLALRGEARTVVGVKIAHQSLSIAILDFSGDVIGEHSAPLAAAVQSTHDLAAQLRTQISIAAEKAGMTMDQISAVGVGLAGIVDATRGFVHWSPSLTERNQPFRDIAQEALGCPVFVDNDANLVAMAELMFGHGKNVQDFIVVTIESGVGMGIVLGGELYRGTRGCGAEFGHTKVQLDGALCRCGQRGCLEAYVADYALLREADVVQNSKQSSARQIAVLLKAARDGDQTAQSIVNRAGRMFAMGLANLVNIFDPQQIILAGERVQFDHLYADGVMASIRQQIVQIDLPPPEIVIHKWGDLMWARGAGAFAIQGVSDMALKDLGEHAS